MKALILNGAPEGHSQLDKAAILLLQELEFLGFPTHYFQLRDLHLAPCQGCFKCWVEHPGICHIDDDGRILIQTLAQCGLMVFFTPVSFGGYGSLLKTAVERSILPSLLPKMVRRAGETHHPLRYGHGISTFAVGLLSQKDETNKEIFRGIVAANARNFDSSRKACAFIYDDMTDDEIHARMELLAAQAKGAKT
jgi:multimeric flavodoxin WrbA